MNEQELRAAAICGVCKKKFGSSGLPLFYRVTIARYGVDGAALRRQTGLEMMMGGHVGLAQALSPEGSMTQTLMEPATMTVCETCAPEDHSVHVLAEMASASAGQSRVRPLSEA
jgi:hypothetical protein